MAKRQASAPAESQQPTALVAAARRIDVGSNTPNGYRHKVQRAKWQEDAWAYFDLIGTVKHGTYFLANTCSLVRLFVAEQPDPDQEPTPPATGTPGLAEAEDAMERLKAGRGGHAQIVRGFVVNLKITGEGFLVGEPEIEAQPATREHPDGIPPVPERWDVRSVSQVVMEGSRYAIKERREGATPRLLPEDTFMLRVWQEHPEFTEEADSALRGVLEECEQLFTLSRAVKAISRSRIATGGMVVFPNSMTIMPAQPDDGDADNPVTKPADFMTTFMEAATAPILDEGHPMAAAPIVVRGPDEHVDKVRYIPFIRPLESELREIRQELRTALASSLDLPMETVEGLAKVSHWTAWKVDQTTWDRYGLPVMYMICEALTVGFLRPMIEEALMTAGATPESASATASGLRVWFDPAAAIADPDQSQTASEGATFGFISGETWRKVAGYGDDDAPSPEELAARAAWMAAQRGGSASTDNPTGQNPGATPVGPPAARALRAMTAASRRRGVGERLAAIDSGLRTRLETAADSAMRRLLERAGAKVRNRAARTNTTVAAIEGVVHADVCARLGPSMVAALGFTDEDLLGDGLGDFEQAFDSRTSRAQAQALAILADELGLSEDEVRYVASRQDDDRHRAWAWLAGALAATATSRLYDPHPEVPVLGEVAVDASVPPGIIREAVALAGGGTGRTVAPQPPGGVALGDLVLEVFAQHGRVVAGWEWSYGDPGSRKQPFEPHEDLDGVQFDSWDDPVLAIGDGGDWIDGDFYRPGDHDSCQCDFTAVGLDEPAAAMAASAAAPVGNLLNGKRR